jgi:hypothetical protein
MDTSYLEENCSPQSPHTITLPRTVLVLHISGGIQKALLSSVLQESIE